MSAPTTVTLPFFKETPGTYRFELDRANQEGVAITSVYVKKAAFPAGAPKAIMLTIAEA